MPTPSAGEPRLLVVGHLTEDFGPGRAATGRLGGAAAYAGLLARGFGVRTTVLTAVDAGFPFLAELEGLHLIRCPSADRTRFENRYRTDGSREQRVPSRAARIPGEAIREAVSGLPSGSAVLYAPVIDELDLGDGALPRPPGFPPGPSQRGRRRALAAVAAQGLLRRLGPEGIVRAFHPPRLAARLSELDLVCLSEADLDGREITGLEGPRLALTRGRRGAVLLGQGRPKRNVPALPADEVDPTGAGDVFAAALTIGLWRGLGEARAARRAAAAAAITVEAPGTSGIPSLTRTFEREREHLVEAQGQS